ncbi:hypothetical protein SAMN04487914_108115 [Arthrobacter sp. ok909]|uniref:hypothetical protein n=1 Tax=Arthrobacter sp. ok909 TaxID=1761746 RepID=UPI000884F2CA|nr:hypothetical protein [Arthrobacter sp. ok909]SDP33713.1 hypothetical protein SAMN04487914_108115 [Arthrobacter sp. ok909]
MSKFIDDIIDLGEVGGQDEMDVLICAFAHLSPDTVVTGKLRLGPQPTRQQTLDRLYGELTFHERSWIGDYFWNKAIDRKLEEHKNRKRTWWDRLLGSDSGSGLTAETYKKPLPKPTPRVKQILELEGEATNG